MADLIALAKKSPGKLNYATAGNGSFGNFSGELLKLLAAWTSCMSLIAAAPPR